LADELLTINADNAGNTLARIATTSSPTSSLTHTIALRTSGSVVRRGESHASAANASQLPALDRPAGTVTDDVMVAHVAMATGSGTLDAPTGWTLLAERTLSPTLSSAVYWKVATALDTGPFAWRFKTGVGTHDIAGGIVTYTNISSVSPIAASATNANPCAGETPLLSITTADELTVTSTSYVATTEGTEHQLVRHVCMSDGVSQSRQVLARELQAVAPATINCAPAACDPLPASVSVMLREPPLPHETRGRAYVLSARTRTG
jgi:hypothetical protein